MRFAESLRAPGFGAIAEFKRRSPSAGELRPRGDITAVARAYESAGARAMSDHDKALYDAAKKEGQVTWYISQVTVQVADALAREDVPARAAVGG